MNLIGIDWSITSPAICLFQGEEWIYENCSFFFFSKKEVKSLFEYNYKAFKYPKWSIQEERIDILTTWAVNIISEYNPDNIAIEGYSYGAKGRAVFDIPECTGVLKYKLYNQHYEPLIYAPTAIKKYATGKGNSNKIQMYESFIKDTQFDLKNAINETTKNPTPSSDIVDAYYVTKFLYDNLENTE